MHRMQPSLFRTLERAKMEMESLERESHAHVVGSQVPLGTYHGGCAQGNQESARAKYRGSP